MYLKDEDIKKVLDDVIRELLIPKFLSLGMNASGNWIDSLSSEVVDGIGYIKGASYTYYLVYGRAGGTPPPIQNLIKWVEYKLGKTGKEGVSIAYAVQTKIADQGTEYYKHNTDLLEIFEGDEFNSYIRAKLGDQVRFNLQREIVKRVRTQLNLT